MADSNIITAAINLGQSGVNYAATTQAANAQKAAAAAQAEAVKTSAWYNLLGIQSTVDASVAQAKTQVDIAKTQASSIIHQSDNQVRQTQLMAVSDLLKSGALGGTPSVASGAKASSNNMLILVIGGVVVLGIVLFALKK
jgi:hypothetical protein